MPCWSNCPRPLRRSRLSRWASSSRPRSLIPTPTSPTSTPSVSSTGASLPGSPGLRPSSSSTLPPRKQSTPCWWTSPETPRSSRPSPTSSMEILPMPLGPVVPMKAGHPMLTQASLIVRGPASSSSTSEPEKNSSGSGSTSQAPPPASKPGLVERILSPFMGSTSPLSKG